MGPRIKKPAVGVDIRRQWLRRFEEEGQSPPQIAEADGYDVRTVRSQIQFAREERETREARALVLRKALELHYDDLIAFAVKLDSALLKPSVIPLPERDDRMCTALREHLPRSPIWKALNRWEHLVTKMWQLEDAAKTRLHEQVGSIDSFMFIQNRGDIGLHPDGLSAVVAECLKSTARFPDRRLPDERFTTESMPEGLVRIAYGAWSCATVPLSQEQEAKDLVADLMNQVGQWPECNSMERVIAELSKLLETLREELATIKLRRIVTGRCRYCPI